MKSSQSTDTLCRRNLRNLIRSRVDAENLGAPPLPATWNYRFRVSKTFTGDGILVAEIWEKSPSVPLLRRRISKASLYGREIDLRNEGNLRRAVRSVAGAAYRGVSHYEPFTYSIVRQRLAAL